MLNSYLDSRYVLSFDVFFEVVRSSTAVFSGRRADSQLVATVRVVAAGAFGALPELEVTADPQDVFQIRFNLNILIFLNIIYI